MTSKEALEELEVILTSNYGTKKNADIFIDNLLKPIEKDLDKLSQLEDIEEEFGIDLKVYHKLMSILYYGDEPNILYVKDRDEIIQVGILEIDYCKQKVCLYSHNTENDYVYGVYGFWQYGKNWALTKEELENDTDSDSIENDRISIEHSASNETYSLDNGAHGETYNLDEIREIIKKKQPIPVTPLREENLLERIADSLDDIKDLLKELLRK